MIEVNIETCIKNVGNKFDLVSISVKRARNIFYGKSKPFIKASGLKVSMIALKEIEQGFLLDILNTFDD